MKVTNDMINPELRKSGEFFRFLVPHISKRKIHLANKLLKRSIGKYNGKYSYENITIQKPDGAMLRLCVYYNQDKLNSPGAGMLWFHGGGYALGIPEQDEKYIDSFLDYGTNVIVAPDYRLSTQGTYHTTVADAYEALLWLQKNGFYYGMNDNQIFVGGDSAGGGLAAATALLARDKGQVNIACQIPLYPMLDDRMITRSSQENDVPVWNTKSNEIAWNMYLGEEYQTEHVSEYAAPARAKSLKGLPPFISFVGSIEPFCDETEIYVHRLKIAGVPVHFKVYEGCYHAFDLIDSQADISKEATTFLKDSYIYALNNYFAEQPK